MPYRYVAYRSTGEEVEGLLDVATEEAAERMLWDSGLTIANLQEARRRASLAESMPTFFGPKPKDVILFSRQLATLVESGIALLPTLQLLADQVTSKPLSRVIEQISEDIQKGVSFAEALQKHPHVFSPLYCRMVEVGERTGSMELILRRLAAYMEKEQAIVSRMRGAMAYPAFVLLLAIGVVAVLINFTLPPMMGLFSEFGAELPWTTRLLIAITNFVTGYRSYILLGAVAVGLMTTFYVSLPMGRRHRDWLLLRLPIFGSINIQGNVARLGRTMATLLRAGLSLPEIMDLTLQTIGNVVVHEAIETLRVESLQGRGLSEPLAANKLFPKMFPQMVRVGEETGTLDSHLETLADFYDEEVDRAVGALTSMLEPALMLFVGLIVAFVAVSIIQPMYSLLGSIGP
ncbi:MAG: type II secretion system F family protein [Anaerolineae bacterium]|nr:type II secretion system F family protein [Anaerolineae bacterium]